MTDDLTPPHWDATSPNIAAELRLCAGAFRENAVYDSEGDPLRLIANAERMERGADTIEALTQQLAVAREALEGYRAAVSYIGADSWDGCSDCIEILRAARSVDTDWHWMPDDIALALKALRARAALAKIGDK